MIVIIQDCKLLHFSMVHNWVIQDDHYNTRLNISTFLHNQQLGINDDIKLQSSLIFSALKGKASVMEIFKKNEKDSI